MITYCIFQCYKWFYAQINSFWKFGRWVPFLIRKNTYSLIAFGSINDWILDMSRVFLFLSFTLFFFHFSFQRHFITSYHCSSPSFQISVFDIAWRRHKDLCVLHWDLHPLFISDARKYIWYKMRKWTPVNKWSYLLFI